MPADAPARATARGPDLPVSGRLGGPVGRSAALGAGALVLVGAAALSLLVGAGGLSPGEVVERLSSGPDGSQAAIIVWDMRVTRALVAAIVGAALGIAGALMQAMTRNPLADPGLLGVTAGDGLAVILTSGFFGVTAFLSNVWPALARLVTGSAGTGLTGAAAAGAVLLSACDLAAQHLLPVDVPVGW